MGGSFGGMMMRHAMAINGSNSYGYSEPRHESTEAEKILEKTDGALKKIKGKREYARGLAVSNFEDALIDNSQVLADAGLLKKGDTLYKILCRAANVPYRKRRKRNDNT